MEAAQIAPSKRAAVAPPKLRYNSFLPNNRRREASEALAQFVASGLPIRDIMKFMCEDDVQCIVEMQVEEMRSRNRFSSPVENAEIVA